MRGVAALLAVCLLAPSPAYSVDGVVELSQTCAENNGCLPGDAAGLPITIGAAGSFRLTGQITVPDANTTAIEITATEGLIELDLNGFMLAGPTVCSGTDPVFPDTPPTRSCIPIGTGSGIRGAGAFQIRVSKGRITGFGSHGIDIPGAVATVSGIEVSSCGGDGVNMFAGTIEGDGVSDCGGNGVTAGLLRFVNASATGCGGDGIAVSEATIDNGYFFGNAGYGVNAAGALVLSESVAVANGSGGVSSGAASNIAGSRASFNFGHGFNVSTYAVISRNAAISNVAVGVNCGTGCQVHGNTASGNLDTGISITERSLASDNVIANNTNQGLVLGADSAYKGNTITNNGPGPLTDVVGPGVEIGPNYCGSDTSCP